MRPVQKALVVTMLGLIVGWFLPEIVLRAQSTWNDTRHEVTLRNDPQSFSCNVFNASGTGLTVFAQATCTAAGIAAGKAMYITDIVASASVVSTTTADQQLELKYGTGSNCGTGTTMVFNYFNAATAGPTVHFTVPIPIPTGNDLCWMHAATGNKSFVVNGYIK